MIMKVVIVDDDCLFIEQLKTCLNHTFQDIDIETYDSFCDEIYTKEYQCVFLDVMLKEGESFPYGINMSKLYPHTIIVYISSVDHFVYESYQQKTFFFIRKSHFHQDYENFVKKYQMNYLQNQENLLLTVSGIQVHIPQKDIIYIESSRNQIMVYTFTQKYISYQTLKQTYQQLNNERFYRLNNHMIINLDHIINIEKKHICLINQMDIPFTRGSKKLFMQRYIQYRSHHIWNGSF